MLPDGVVVDDRIVVRPPPFSLVDEELDGYVGWDEVLDVKPPPPKLNGDELGRVDGTLDDDPPPPPL